MPCIAVSDLKRRWCVVQVSKYNRFSLSCKPPAANNLEGFAEADAQSNQLDQPVNPRSMHETCETCRITFAPHRIIEAHCETRETDNNLTPRRGVRGSRRLPFLASRVFA